jgi:integrase
MASICDDGNGLKRILVVCPDGERRAIRLGHANKKQADSAKGHIEQIISAETLGQSRDPKTQAWLDEIDDVLYERIAAAKLVKPRAAGKGSIVAFIDGHLDRNTKLKPNTVLNFKQLRRWVAEFFGEDGAMHKVTVAEAEDFRSYMVKGGLGENTVRRHLGRCRQLWKAAIRRGAVRGANPFENFKTKVGSNKEREFFVSRETVQKCIDAATDTEWKLIIALSRYGGLRCPSEHLALTWADVHWDSDAAKETILVRSPKTEHIEGKESRLIPLFSELRPYLMDAYTKAEPGQPHVIAQHRDRNANLRTQFKRIIKRAGVKPWPKLFHNLRSSRQTELAAEYPIQAVCDWIGNSIEIAKEHYLQTTDDLFAKAATPKAAQKAAQQKCEVVGNGEKSAGSKNEKPGELPGNSQLVTASALTGYPHGESNPGPLAENQIS